jgi:hypothetical protein
LQAYHFSPGSNVRAPCAICAFLSSRDVVTCSAAGMGQRDVARWEEGPAGLLESAWRWRREIELGRAPAVGRKGSGRPSCFVGSTRTRNALGAGWFIASSGTKIWGLSRGCVDLNLSPPFLNFDQEPISSSSWFSALHHYTSLQLCIQSSRLVCTMLFTLSLSTLLKKLIDRAEIVFLLGFRGYIR